MFAILYYRVSTEEQKKDGYSLADQREACTTLARELGAKELLEIEDAAEAGGFLNRPGLEQARSIIQRGGVDLFICLDPDRFSRELVDQLLVTKEIEEAGVRLAFVNFERERTPEGDAFYQMRGIFSQFEKAQTRRRTMSGKRAKARSGKLTHNPRTYGYDYDASTSMLVINEADASIVRRIYQMYSNEERGVEWIAHQLNTEGIPSPGGSVWQKMTVKRILSNETYTGTLYLNRFNSEGKKYNRYRTTNKVSVTERPRSEWIPVSVPAIIDRDTFEKVQKLFKRRRRLRPGHAKVPFLLTGLVRCELCGGTVHGFSMVNRPHCGRLIYYVCANRPTRKEQPLKCRLPYLPARNLECAVWDIVSRWLSNPEGIRMAMESQHIDVDATRAQIRELNRTIDRFAQDRARILRLLAKGLVTEEEAEEELVQIKRQVTEQTNKRDALAERLKPDQVELTPRLLEISSRVDDSLEHLPFDDRKKLLGDVIRQIIVGPDTLTIHPYSDPPTAI